MVIDPEMQETGWTLATLGASQGLSMDQVAQLQGNRFRVWREKCQLAQS